MSYVKFWYIGIEVHNKEIAVFPRQSYEIDLFCLWRLL